MVAPSRRGWSSRSTTGSRRCAPTGGRTSCRSGASGSETHSTTTARRRRGMPATSRPTRRARSRLKTGGTPSMLEGTSTATRADAGRPRRATRRRRSRSTTTTATRRRRMPGPASRAAAFGSSPPSPAMAWFSFPDRRDAVRVRARLERRQSSSGPDAAPRSCRRRRPRRRGSPRPRRPGTPISPTASGASRIEPGARKQQPRRDLGLHRERQVQHARAGSAPRRPGRRARSRPPDPDTSMWCVIASTATAMPAPTARPPRTSRSARSPRGTSRPASQRPPRPARNRPTTARRPAAARRRHGRQLGACRPRPAHP